MLDVKAWVVSKLKADTTLTAALGNADKIQFYYPQNFNSLPVVTYTETNQPTVEYRDDLPLAVETFIEIHVWTAQSVSTSTISKAVDAVMRGLLFNVDFSADFQEPETRINHRVLRYRRKITALDLV